MSKPRPVPDQPARDLISARLDINLLVEAGAGSGKTECLARRMAAGVLEGRYKVEHMAAVTFTRKAAAELRGALPAHAGARAGGRAGPTPGGSAPSRPCAHLERLFAGTIHAFCAHLLRERPVEAGVAPGFTELDEIAEMDQRRWAWRDYLDRQRGPGSPALRELLDAGARPVDLDRAFDTVCNYPEVDFPAGDAPRPDPAQARAALERFWAALIALAPRRRTPRDHLQRPEAHARVRAAAPGGVARGPARRSPSWSPMGERAQDRPEVVADAARRTRSRWRRSFTALHRDALPFLDAWYRYVYRLALTLLLEGREHAAAARRRAVTLNYDDLLQYAATLLRDNLEVRAALQDKYRWLFVDEFQDTDPIQAEVILLLAAAPSAERDWTRVPLRPGALFVVGDPKQSIYRFRRADIDIYQRVRQRIEATGGQVATLTACFRSVPAALRLGQHRLRQAVPAEATPHQPGFAGLQAARDDSGRRVRRARHRGSRHRLGRRRGGAPSMPRRSPASSGRRWTRAGARPATSSS